MARASEFNKDGVILGAFCGLTDHVSDHNYDYLHTTAL